MQQEEMDIQLWEYIDGTCNAADRERISLLITTNTAWEQQYREMLAMHNMMQAELSPTPVNKAFTESVMTQLAPAAEPAKKKALNLSIKAVACFFIVAVVGLSIYAIINTDWNFSKPATTAVKIPNIKFRMPEANLNISSSGVAIAGFSAVVFLLMMADNLFRRRLPGRL